MKKLTSVICICVLFLTLAGCNAKPQPIVSTPVNAKDFRITVYISCDNAALTENLDSSHFDILTDIIMIGNADYNEQGEIILKESFDKNLSDIRQYMKKEQRLYLNIILPMPENDETEWEKQMAVLADANTKAFKSGKLETEIKDTLEKYGFDGVFFDYEFPLRKKDWKAFDKFIVSLDKVLGDDYLIGMSMVGWNLQQSKEAMEATDLFTVMSYDIWDENGYHASTQMAEDDIEKFINAGYDKAKLDMGVPFYARPTTHDAYWYSYKDYYKKLSEDGLYTDKGETDLVFSFNTYDMIYDKTQWALENGVGGMMVWHYACDVSADNKKSLFNAMEKAKSEAVEKETN